MLYHFFARQQYIILDLKEKQIFLLVNMLIIVRFLYILNQTFVKHIYFE